MGNDLVEERIEEEIKVEEKHTRFGFLITGTVIVFLVINLIYLNIFIFNQQTISDVVKQPSNTSITSTPTEIPTPTSIIQPTATPASALTSPNVQKEAVKEYFVSFGSGTSQVTDWTDVPGMQATADFGQYSNIKEVRFEASVYVPTGNQSVSVRLFNVTDKHPVWYSEVNMSGGVSAYLTSSPVIYDLGSKLYQVQIKTQLGAPTNLVQARLHIILQ